MKSFRFALVGLGFVMAVLPAQATVIHFDDITTGGGTVAVGTYMGFTWDVNCYVVGNSIYNTSYGNTVSFPSAPNALVNASGVVSVAITSGAQFQFNGLQAATFAIGDAFGTASSTSLTVKGYLNSVFVGQSTLQLGVAFASMSGIAGTLDELRFENDGNNRRWWLADDINVSSPVPEPFTMGLAGLALAAAARRRLRKSA